MKLRVLTVVALLTTGCVSMPLVTGSAYEISNQDKMSQKGKFGTLIVESISEDSINFKFQNDSEKTSKIIWDEASIVDIDGMAHKVIHHGVKYADAGGAMPPTSVPSGASIGELASYADGIQYNPGSASAYIVIPPSWSKRELIPCSRVMAKCEYAKAEGKSIKLILPVEQDGKRQEYRATILIRQTEASKQAIAKHEAQKKAGVPSSMPSN